MAAAPIKLLIYLVPEGGLEPPQGYPYRILSPARLPFHHSGTKAADAANRRVGFRRAMVRWSQAP